MFERFTERARQVVVLAQDEARTLKHKQIGTGHLLLGLLREEEGLAARVLVSLDVTFDEARAQVATSSIQGDEITTGQMPFTPRAKRVLESSVEEGHSLGHNYVGTEHLLLGLVRENEGVASRILRERFDLDADKIRNEIIRMLSGPGRRRAARTDFEIERIRAEKEAAIGAQDFQSAASLRDQERKLVREIAGEVGRTVGGSMVQTHTVRHVVRRLPQRSLRHEWPAMAAGAGLLSLGVIIGRVIWG